jgi:type IV fimbrial biogenesis protein FimT
MRTHHGYTLIEILITFALISVLLIIAIPSWQNIRSSYNTELEINRLVATLQYARNCAINLQLPVRICASNDGQICLKTQEHSWCHGWLVYLAQSTLLRAYPALTNGELVWHGLGNNNEIQFNSDGSATGFNGRFDYYPNNNSADNCKSIVLSPTGRVRVNDLSCAASH